MSLGKLEKETEQDINYDNITMEMSEDSSHNEDSSNRSNSVDSNSTLESNHSGGGKKSKKKMEYSHRSEERKRHSVSPEDQRNRDDRRRKYGKDSHHRDRERDREDRRSYRRSRSPSYHRYDRSRRSHSRSPRDRGRHSRRDQHSPERRRRDHHERSRGNSDRKPSRLSVLDKLGIELKLPEKDKDGSRLSLPSYYNPMVVNPAKYAEQIAKRKLLWGNNSQKQKPLGEVKEEVLPDPKASGQNIWQGARFSQDQDGKLTAKFQRLMGIKNVANGPEQQPSSSHQAKPEKDLLKKQEEMFSSMELQYEVARQATHTQRGVGLGFGAHHFPPK